MPFFSISGSDFVEMFVGVGASPRSRPVRTGEEVARRASSSSTRSTRSAASAAPASAAVTTSASKRSNQLLVEMDGFDQNTGVILIAATNRPDVLDPALLRPGRFDRQIVVDRADVKGRAAILAVHAKNKPLSKEISLDTLAKRTPGFSGADLENLLNEAALLAARRNKIVIEMSRLRRGDRSRRGGSRTQVARHVAKRKREHGLSRVGPRDRRRAAAQRRSGAQGDDHPARDGAGHHLVAARRRPPFA